VETITRSGWSDALGCEELGRRGTVDTSGCCAICHSADVYNAAFLLGPCLTKLQGGGAALVCCAVRKQLRAAGRTEAGTRGDAL
jgi:hypothetical protein